MQGCSDSMKHVTQAPLVSRGCSLHEILNTTIWRIQDTPSATVCKFKAQSVVTFLGAQCSDAHLRLEDLDQLQFSSPLQLKALNSTPPVASYSCLHRHARGPSSLLSSAPNTVGASLLLEMHCCCWGCITALGDALLLLEMHHDCCWRSIPALCDTAPVSVLMG